MSFLHVHRGSQAQTVQLNDGKSDSLHRHVHLDTGEMYYNMGKQIGGKPIKPDGRLGRKLWAIANEIPLNGEGIPGPRKEYRTARWVATAMVWAILLVFVLKYC